MGPILQCFLCGMAFIGGGFVMVLMISLGRATMDKEYREEVRRDWEATHEFQAQQVAVLNRLAIAVEMYRNKIIASDA